MYVSFITIFSHGNKYRASIFAHINITDVLINGFEYSFNSANSA